MKEAMGPGLAEAVTERLAERRSWIARRSSLLIDAAAIVFVVLLGLWAWSTIDAPLSAAPALGARWSYYSFSDFLTMLAGRRFYDEGFVRNFLLANMTVGYREFARGWYYYQEPQIVSNSAIYYMHHGALDAIINGFLRHLGFIRLPDFYKIAATFSVTSLLFWYGLAARLFHRPVAIISVLFMGTAYVFTRLLETIAYYSYDLFFAFGAMFLFTAADLPRFRGRAAAKTLLVGSWIFCFLQTRNSLEWVLFLQIFFLGYYIILHGRGALSRWRAVLALLSAPLLGLSLQLAQIAWVLGGVAAGLDDLKMAFLRRTVEFGMAEEVGFRNFTIPEGLAYIRPFLVDRLGLGWVIILVLLALPALMLRLRGTDARTRGEIAAHVKLILLVGVGGAVYLAVFFQNTVTGMPYVVRLLLPFASLLFSYAVVTLSWAVRRFALSKDKAVHKIVWLVPVVVALVPISAVTTETVQKFEPGYHMLAYSDDGTKVGRWEYEYLGRHPDQIVALGDYIQQHTGYGDVIVTDIDTGATGHPRYPHPAYEYYATRRFEKFAGLKSFQEGWRALQGIRDRLTADNPAKQINFYLLVEDAKSDANVLAYVASLGIKPIHFTLTTSGSAASNGHPVADIVNGARVYHRTLSWHFGVGGKANVLLRGTNLTDDAEMFTIPDKDLVYILEHGQGAIRPLDSSYRLSDRDIYDALGYIREVLRAGVPDKALAVAYTLYPLDSER